MSRHFSRRYFLRTTAGLSMLPMTGWASTSSPKTPACEQGLALGDISLEGLIVWSRTDQLAQFNVEWSQYEDFRYAHQCAPVNAYRGDDFTSKIALRDLPADRDVFIRAHYRSLASGKTSPQLTARLRTPSKQNTRPYKFAWSGDLGGQGFGINPEIGGYRIFDAISKTNPDFFINCGDVIYADAPLKLERKLSNGKQWYNLVTPEKEAVAQSLAQFRGNFRYNYFDEHFKNFNASCPQIYTWDDHETKNNWWPHLRLNDRRYSEKRTDLLSAWARKSFFEYLPVAQKISSPNRLYRKLSQGPLVDIFVLDTRSYRGPNTKGTQTRQSRKTALLGAQQLDWLRKGLVNSTARWKLVVCPQPIALNVFHHHGTFDGISNGHNGKPRGRELEFAQLLSLLKESKTRNVVWLTADVHYAAAHHYHPKRANFKDFDPFWEFVAGPLNAGTFGPNPLDATFGPQVVYKSVERGMKQALSPLEPYQFFGTGEVDPETGALTIAFYNQLGERLWSQTLESRA